MSAAAAATQDPAPPADDKLSEFDLIQQKNLVDSLGPNEGYLTWRSSPHVMWLAFMIDLGRAH